jgi:hypothetical protein
MDSRISNAIDELTNNGIQISFESLIKQLYHTDEIDNNMMEELGKAYPIDALTGFLFIVNNMPDFENGLTYFLNKLPTNSPEDYKEKTIYNKYHSLKLETHLIPIRLIKNWLQEKRNYRQNEKSRNSELLLVNYKEKTTLTISEFEHLSVYLNQHIKNGLLSIPENLMDGCIYFIQRNLNLSNFELEKLFIKNSDFPVENAFFLKLTNSAKDEKTLNLFKNALGGLLNLWSSYFLKLPNPSDYINQVKNKVYRDYNPLQRDMPIMNDRMMYERIIKKPDYKLEDLYIAAGYYFLDCLLSNKPM